MQWFSANGIHWPWVTSRAYSCFLEGQSDQLYCTVKFLPKTRNIFNYVYSTESLRDKYGKHVAKQAVPLPVEALTFK
jgi:hypothetical protein